VGRPSLADLGIGASMGLVLLAERSAVIIIEDTYGCKVVLMKDGRTAWNDASDMLCEQCLSRTACSSVESVEPLASFQMRTRSRLGPLCASNSWCRYIETEVNAKAVIRIRLSDIFMSSNASSVYDYSTDTDTTTLRPDP
jgi:hypothetical protein